jgi:hypothetical protein
VVLAGVGSAIAACGEDDNIVRMRPDGGGDAGLDGETGAGMLACGVTVPTTYESPMFALNAREELDLRARLGELDTKMKSAEGAGVAAVTGSELQAIFTMGAPNLRSIATAAAQAKVDDYLAAFGGAAVAGGKSWVPANAEAEGGAPSGGKYESADIVSGLGLALREAVAKTLLGGALYNDAVALSTGAVTEATVDRLLALYGATPKFANRTDADAGPDEKDELVAAFASRRDNKSAQALGPYRKIRGALLVAKGAAAGGDKCRADLDAALSVYFLQWEKATYATAIFYLNAAATNASATPARGAQALNAFGQALGILQSFKGIPQDRRKITDAQIDAILDRVGAATPYKLVTESSTRVVAFNTAYQDIGAVYGMTQIEIEDAKKDY